MLVYGVEVDMESLYLKYGEKEKVKMISEVREISGAGLKDAKDAVDYFIAVKQGKIIDNGDEQKFSKKPGNKPEKRNLI